MTMEPTKVCNKCGRELPVSSFSRNCAYKDGINGACKECVKNNRKKSNSINPQPGFKATFKISDFTDEMIFAELRRRGYLGELRHIKIVNL